MAQPALHQSEYRPEYRHRAERWEIDCDIAIDDGCGRELSARLGNVSAGGFMCECEERLPLRTVVLADLPGRGKVRAEVRWVFGWRFGAMILPD